MTLLKQVSFSAARRAVEIADQSSSTPSTSPDSTVRLGKAKWLDIHPVAPDNYR